MPALLMPATKETVLIALELLTNSTPPKLSRMLLKVTVLPEVPFGIQLM